MPESRKVVFTSIGGLVFTAERLRELGYEILELRIRDPETGEVKILYVPKKQPGE